MRGVVSIGLPAVEHEPVGQRQPAAPAQGGLDPEAARGRPVAGPPLSDDSNSPDHVERGDRPFGGGAWRPPLDEEQPPAAVHDENLVDSRAQVAAQAYQAKPAEEEHGGSPGDQRPPGVGPVERHVVRGYEQREPEGG